MKALEVKYLSCTNTKPERLKLIVEGLAGEVELRDAETEFEAQAQEMAQAFIEKMEWDTEISGSGQLANGNWVFTLTGSGRTI